MARTWKYMYKLKQARKQGVCVCVCVCVCACAHTFQEQPEGIFYSAGASLKAGRFSF